MAIKFKEIRRFLARNIRLSICFLDGQYHNYLLVSDISASEYDELYVYGIGMTDVEFSKNIYSESEEPNGEVSISMSNLTIQPALEIVLSDKPRDIERKAAHIKEDKQRIIEIEGKFSGIDTLKDLLKM